MLYLTYDTNGMRDGMGAQYQRVVGIIAIAEHYGATYVHTPVKHIQHGISSASTENLFGLRGNFPSVDDLTYDDIHTIRLPSDRDIIDFMGQATTTGRKVLLKILLPYLILEDWGASNPKPLHIIRENQLSIYDKVMPKLRTLMVAPAESSYDADFFNVALHIRRGDVSATSNASHYRPLNNYTTIIEHLKCALSPRDRSGVLKTKLFHIYTQITNENWHEFDTLVADPTVVLHANEDALTSFYHMARMADVLVTGSSSFSILAGLYQHNAVFYTDYWHKPLLRWMPIGGTPAKN